MRRLALLVTAVGLAAPAAAGAADAPPLRATLAACATGPGPADRSVAFTGSMPAAGAAGARRMAMRFELQRRAPSGSAYASVAVPGLATWVTSAPARSGFVYTQRVRRLQAPGLYRAVIRFRWLAADGHVLRSVRRTTPACAQPDRRPDLRAGGLTADPASTPGAPITYRLTVIDTGRTAAGPFDVMLEVDGAPAVTTRASDGVAAGGEIVLTFAAPACRPGTTVRVTVDSAGEVAESVEPDDAVARLCPLAP
jgi:CARDB